MSKRKPASKYLPYPKEDGLRAGIKVCWLYYKNRDDARTASMAAVHNARVQESLGYDFGYCAPGSIEQVDSSRGMPERIGMFEVCIP
jgi:hypothetical protein